MCNVHPVTKRSDPHERLKQARLAAGHSSAAAFAKVAGLSEVTYRAYESGQNGFSHIAASLAARLGTTADYLLGGDGDPPPSKRRAGDEAGPSSRTPEQPSPRTADGGETAPVLRLDLSYSMGPGRDLDDSYVEGEPVEFDIGFLRSLTLTPADRIRIVDGIGDSMQPTLHDRDLLFVDVNQADLNAQDRIWAIWLFGLGAVKRLRAIDPERVLVISDNPEIEDQVVSRKDIMIHGRVVGSIKRH